MSITDELREWTRNYTVNCSDTRIALVAIANRIDAEHEQQMAERRRSCVFYDAERNYCKVHDEGDMAELGYVRLPVDTDGVPIRIGDVMEWRYGNGEFEVIGIGGNTLFYIDKDSNECEWTAASDKIHHYAPTVEDVLREMLDVWGELPSNVTNEAIIAEYAARLRLAGEDA